MSNDEVRKIYEFVRKASSPAVRLYPDIVEQWALCQVNAISNEEAWRADFAKQLAKVDLQLKELLRRDSNWESKRVSNSTTVTAAASSFCCQRAQRGPAPLGLVDVRNGQDAVDR